MKKKLKAALIENGTVIDHLPPGSAMKILGILDSDLWERDGHTIIPLMNVPSSKHGKKDLIKIEGIELTDEQLKYISLLAPYATVNIIKDYEVVEKKKIEVPDKVKGILRCPNQRCITNSEEGQISEPIDYKFIVVKRDYPLRLKCYYCEKFIEQKYIPDLLRYRR